VNVENFLASGELRSPDPHQGSVPGPRWGTLFPRSPALPPRFPHSGYGPDWLYICKLKLHLPRLLWIYCTTNYTTIAHNCQDAAQLVVVLQLRYKFKLVENGMYWQ